MIPSSKKRHDYLLRHDKLFLGVESKLCLDLGNVCVSKRSSVNFFLSLILGPKANGCSVLRFKFKSALVTIEGPVTES